MKKRNKILALLAAFAIAFSSVACANNTSDSYDSISPVVERAENVSSEVNSLEYDNIEAKSVADEQVYEKKLAPESSLGLDSGITASTPEPALAKRKLIVNFNLSLETKEFDKGVAEIEALATNFNGYMESSSIQGTNMQSRSNPRYANFTLRIPSSGSAQFIEQLGGQFNVVSTSQSTQDVTDSYYDIETRLETLVEQEKRLNALLDTGGDLQYLLEVEREIANVRYQINSIHNQLKNMDSFIDFSQITISLAEVIDYEEVQQIDDTFAIRVKRAFRTSWNDFVDFGKDSVISAIYMLPSLIIMAIIFTIIIVLIKRARKKSKKKIVEIQTDTTNVPANKDSKDTKLK